MPVEARFFETWLKQANGLLMESSAPDPLFADRLETALRVRQSMVWGKLGNLLCLLPPLPRDVTVSSARGGLSAATHSSVSHQGGRGGF